MKRRVFNFAAGVSLVLCLATIALWVRSHWRSDSLHYSSELGADFAQTQDILVSQWGSMVFARARNQQRSPAARQVFTPGLWFLSDPAHLFEDPRITVRSIGREYIGFGHYSTKRASPSTGPWQQLYSYRQVIAPHWAIALLLALAAGRCADCGYDLRATPDRCPECGAVPSSSASPFHPPQSGDL